MLKIKPVNHTAFRSVMDAHRRIYKTHEAENEIPEEWGLEDPMIRRDAVLVQWENLFGIIYDGGTPHVRRTVKSRHEWEEFQYGSA